MSDMCHSYTTSLPMSYIHNLSEFIFISWRRCNNLVYICLYLAKFELQVILFHSSYSYGLNSRTKWMKQNLPEFEFGSAISISTPITYTIHTLRYTYVCVCELKICNLSKKMVKSGTSRKAFINLVLLLRFIRNFLMNVWWS